VKKTIAILGSTGSIGKSAISVVEQFHDEMEVILLSANNNIELLSAQCKKLNPKYVVVSGNSKVSLNTADISVCKNWDDLSAKILNTGTKIDILVLAISGFAGIEPCMKLMPHIKTMAIANKESIVCLKKIFVNEAINHSVNIIPIDSEHNALYQIFNNSIKKTDIKHITITASGGPFWKDSTNINEVSLETVLNHPIWSMGVKNTIDSATMVNKGLEVIEASILFDLTEDKIKVLVHPQSIIHAMVTMHDNSTFALLSNPDMKFHIANAIRNNSHDEPCVPEIDFTKMRDLTFFPTDNPKCRAIDLARNALNASHAHLVAFNAANEVMVNLFCNQKVKFGDIVRHIEMILDEVVPEEFDQVADIMRCDEEVRNKILSMCL